jgi:ribosomal protein S27AE
MPSVKKQRKGANDMMKREMLNKGALYTLDLTKIEGDGSFPCPKCGTKISPEDETEDVYTIVDTKVNNDELVELVIACGNCGTHIRLVGFEQTTEDIANE